MTKTIDRFELIINIPETGVSLRAKIQTLKLPRFVRPSHGNLTAYLIPNPFLIHVVYSDDNRYYKELNMSFRYEDVYQDSVSNNEIEISIGKYLYAPDGTNYEFELHLDRILNKLRAYVPDKPAGILYRRVGNFDIEFIVTDDHFKRYKDSYQYSFDGTGLIWSNIEGNGIGLFSHYVSGKIDNLKFDSKTVDSIANSPTTQHLGFVKWH